jgi:hypothetical protein
VFEETENENLKELIHRFIYIVQDINSIKGHSQNLGNLLKIRLRNSTEHYELAVGSTYFKINKYKVD